MYLIVEVQGDVLEDHNDPVFRKKTDWKSNVSMIQPLFQQFVFIVVYD